MTLIYCPVFSFCTVFSSCLLSLLSKALADYSKQFVISVALGKDLVPRWDWVKRPNGHQSDACLISFVRVKVWLYLESLFLAPFISLLFVLSGSYHFLKLCSFCFCRLSIPNMEDLKRRLLKMVSNCSKPKVRSFTRCKSDTLPAFTLSVMYFCLSV